MLAQTKRRDAKTLIAISPYFNTGRIVNLGLGLKIPWEDGGLANKCMAAPDLTATQAGIVRLAEGGVARVSVIKVDKPGSGWGIFRPWALSLTPSIGLWLKSYGSAAGVLHMQAGESWAKASQDKHQSHHSLVSCILILPRLKDYALS
ncbi:hypothetical protein MAJ_06987, partial [Metarhizium majus ARSEF 297]